MSYAQLKQKPWSINRAKYIKQRHNTTSILVFIFSPSLPTPPTPNIKQFGHLIFLLTLRVFTPHDQDNLEPKFQVGTNSFIIGVRFKLNLPVLGKIRKF